MKKLIAILLVLACMLAIASCGANGGTTPPAGDGGNTEQPSTDAEAQKILDDLTTMIRDSRPTKSVTTTRTGSDDVHLDSEIIIVKGELSGKEAGTYKKTYETFNEVGAKDAKTVTVETKEYLEGKGVRENRGDWVDMDSFLKRIQPYRPNLDTAFIEGFSYNKDKTTFEFVILNENLSYVLTNMDVSNIVNDVTVVIETDGAAVTRIALNYDMRTVANMEKPHVTVEALYSYNLESVELINAK